MPDVSWEMPQGFEPGQMPGGDGKDSGGMMGGGGGGMFNTGTAGPLRLFQSQLSGQISWLLPFVLLGAIGLLRNSQKTAVNG